ncbi:MAG: hypothetical protein QG673_1126, partial [Pseudomonadota bacterium]|nr:hypothetical protein [Pseudomonadota bacterium]
SRDYSIGAADSSGAFWMFGGNGYANSSTFGYLNDLWKYVPPSN